MRSHPRRALRPPRPAGAKTGIIIGIIVAVVVLLAGCGAVIGLATAGGSEPEEPPPGEPENPREPEEPSDEPEGGSLRSLVRERVGPFRLQESSRWPEARRNGASEAYQLEYRSSRGELLHGMAAFSSPETAAAVKDGFVENFESEGFSAGSEQEVRNEQGEQVGTLTAMTNSNQGLELIVWSNGPLFCFALSGTGNAATFYRSVPYRCSSTTTPTAPPTSGWRS